MRSLPQATGPTENALRALLDRQLAGSSIPGYLGWVCLNVAAPEGSRGTLQAQLARATRCEPGRAGETVDRLIALGLLDGDARPTRDGRRELDAARRRVKTVTDRVLAGLPEEDLATAVGVLDQVRIRAESLLEA